MPRPGAIAKRVVSNVDATRRRPFVWTRRDDVARRALAADLYSKSRSSNRRVFSSDEMSDGDHAVTFTCLQKIWSIFPQRAKRKHDLNWARPSDCLQKHQSNVLFNCAF